MTGRTTIEWTAQPGYAPAVWNPTVGCTRVSAGCDNCYAFALHDKRYASNLKVSVALPYDREKGAGGAYKPAGAREIGAALPWPKQYDLPFSHVQLLEDRLDAPLRTRKPTCYFVDSMADLFHEDVPDEFIGRVWDTMWGATQHRFLVLTKRPERMREWVTARVKRDSLPIHHGDLMPSNVWLGTSVENQAAADERIHELEQTFAAVRFLSCEPLLGPVEIPGVGPGDSAHIDWIIVGGESGPRARPMDLAWARSLVKQGQLACSAVFVKQLGRRPQMGYGDGAMQTITAYPVRDSHGGDPAEWPEDLRVRQWPEAA
jgi:protein gp37